MHFHTEWGAALQKYDEGYQKNSATVMSAP